MFPWVLVRLENLPSRVSDVLYCSKSCLRPVQINVHLLLGTFEMSAAFSDKPESLSQVCEPVIGGLFQLSNSVQFNGKRLPTMRPYQKTRKFV
jgi:hypothetical protein